MEVMNTSQSNVSMAQDVMQPINNAQLVSSTIELLNEDQPGTALQSSTEFDLQKSVLSAAYTGMGGLIDALV